MIPQTHKVLPPRLPAEDIYGVVVLTCACLSTVREVIARIVDDSDFDEFQSLTFGMTLVCGFATSYRRQSSLVLSATNGILFAESARKGLTLSALCAEAKVPLLFPTEEHYRIHGRQKVEEGGIAKHGAKLVMAVACADVPKFTIIIQWRIYGVRTDHGMCGRAYGANDDVDVAYARISVMGGEASTRTCTHPSQA
nr:carboxyl transferase domain-containing protein [Vibrio neptunius]